VRKLIIASVVIVIGALTAGCAAKLPPNPLSQTERASFAFQEFEVKFDGKLAGVADEEDKAELLSDIKAGLKKVFQRVHNGTKQVRLVATVTEYGVPSAGLQLLFSTNEYVKGKAEFFDIETDQRLVSYDVVTQVAHAGGLGGLIANAIVDPGDRLGIQFASKIMQRHTQ